LNGVDLATTIINLNNAIASNAALIANLNASLNLAISALQTQVQQKCLEIIFTDYFSIN